MTTAQRATLVPLRYRDRITGERVNVIRYPSPNRLGLAELNRRTA